MRCSIGERFEFFSNVDIGKVFQPGKPRARFDFELPPRIPWRLALATPNPVVFFVLNRCQALVVVDLCISRSSQSLKVRTLGSLALGRGITR